MAQVDNFSYAGQPNRRAEQIENNLTKIDPDEKHPGPAEQRCRVKLTPSAQPISERFPALAEQEAVLTFYAPEAKMVQVAGTFNGWHPEADPMEPTGSGEWIARLLLKTGRYEYRFVVDGVWTDDAISRKARPIPMGSAFRF